MRTVIRLRLWSIAFKLEFSAVWCCRCLVNTQSLWIPLRKACNCSASTRLFGCGQRCRPWTGSFHHRSGSSEESAKCEFCCYRCSTAEFIAPGPHQLTPRRASRPCRAPHLQFWTVLKYLDMNAFCTQRCHSWSPIFYY